MSKELFESVKKQSREDLEKYYIQLLVDSSDTDTYIRDRVKGILTDFEINGDSYGVPSIEDIVNLLCEKIEDWKEKEKDYNISQGL
jgi:hypothetical protein